MKSISIIAITAITFLLTGCPGACENRGGIGGYKCLDDVQVETTSPHAAEFIS